MGDLQTRIGKRKYYPNKSWIRPPDPSTHHNNVDSADASKSTTPTTEGEGSAGSPSLLARMKIFQASAEGTPALRFNDYPGAAKSLLDRIQLELNTNDVVHSPTRSIENMDLDSEESVQGIPPQTPDVTMDPFLSGFQTARSGTEAHKFFTYNLEHQHSTHPTTYDDTSRLDSMIQTNCQAIDAPDVSINHSTSVGLKPETVQNNPYLKETSMEMITIQNPYSPSSGTGYLLARLRGRHTQDHPTTNAPTQGDQLHHHASKKNIISHLVIQNAERRGELSDEGHTPRNILDRLNNMITDDFHLKFEKTLQSAQEQLSAITVETKAERSKSPNLENPPHPSEMPEARSHKANTHDIAESISESATANSKRRRTPTSPRRKYLSNPGTPESNNSSHIQSPQQINRPDPDPPLRPTHPAIYQRSASPARSSAHPPMRSPGRSYTYHTNYFRHSPRLSRYRSPSPPNFHHNLPSSHTRRHTFTHTGRLSRNSDGFQSPNYFQTSRPYNHFNSPPRSPYQFKLEPFSPRIDFQRRRSRSPHRTRNLSYNPPSSSNRLVYSPELLPKAGPSHERSDNSVRAMSQTSEPKEAVNDKENRVPGIWFAKIGLSTLGVLECQFEVDGATSSRWLIGGDPNSKSCSEVHKHNNEQLLLQLRCIPVDNAQTTLQVVNSTWQPEDIARTMSDIKTRWPGTGNLIIELNPGTTYAKSWFPQDMIADTPLDATKHVQPGSNIIRFIQLAGMSEYMFLLYASQHNNQMRELGQVSRAVSHRLTKV